MYPRSFLSKQGRLGKPLRQTGGSNPFEPSVQFVSGKYKGRWPAVRTMVGILAQIPIFQQDRYLLGRQFVTCLDGSFAGHHVHQFVDGIPPFRF